MIFWDTDAIISILKNPDGKKIISYLIISGKIYIIGTTITELLASPPRTEEESDLISQITYDTSIYIQPEQTDYIEAGLWLRLVNVTEGSKRDKKSKRKELALDAILASTAWSRNIGVVTLNKKDFDNIYKSSNKKGIILTPDDALSVLPH